MKLYSAKAPNGEERFLIETDENGEVYPFSTMRSAVVAYKAGQEFCEGFLSCSKDFYTDLKEINY